MDKETEQKYYLCIDLKSFYASVECVERGLDPMTTNLVVADSSRTDKTICLAVSPSMKALGVKNRCRVFEIPKGIDYIMATPRMQKYIDYSAQIYDTYLDYISKDDIYVYSIDEVFMDITHYLKLYNKTPRELALMLMDAVTEKVGVRATAGIGTNLYLTKIALDIMAKHSPDFVGYLDEELFKEKLWNHQPLTDFWRIGRGTAKKLMDHGIYNMRGIAEGDHDMLYRIFGVDAELMIDHAFGIEPVTMKDIKEYKPSSHSLTEGQVLMRDYTKEEGRLITSEMVTEMCLRLKDKNLLTESLSIYVRFSARYEDEPVRGTAGLPIATSSETIIQKEVLKVYDNIIEEGMHIRGILLSANNTEEDTGEFQMTMFTEEAEDVVNRDNKIQQAMLDIKHKFGKNAMIKAQDLEEAATTIERNMQIGGHKSGNENQ